MTSPQHSKVLILGSGPAGYTAAVYAARANLQPTLITGMAQGGQLMTTTDVDNWPADVHGVQGPDLMQRFLEHAERFNTQMVFDHINKVDFSKRPFTLMGDSGTYTCDALIIATGASAKYLGLPSEQSFMGRGVSGCATCDGFFYREQVCCVVGGGNTAVEEALYLSNIATKVHLIHRRDTFKASKIMQDRALANPKIEVVYNSAVETLHGEGKLTGVTLKSTVDDSTSELALDGLFIAIGNDPRVWLVEDQIELTEDKFMKVDGRSSRTSLPGVFACGDVKDHVYRQAITAAGSGCMAAIDAERWLEQQH